MTLPTDDMPETIDETLEARSPTRLSAIRTFGWLVRRELWEHPAIWIAPLAIAGVAVFAHFISELLTSDTVRVGCLADPKKAESFMMLYGAVSMVILVMGLLVGVLYSLDALQGERRDRSILFWKSLPVSDRMTVLSKAIVPIVILPLLSFAVIVAATILMVGLQTVAWQVRGFDPQQLWAKLNLPFLWLSLAYGLPFMALWYAPFFAWFLLVSAWARRMVVLWAFAPLLAILAVEHTVFHTTFHWVPERYIGGGVLHPYTLGGQGRVWVGNLTQLEPLRIYAHPGLWIGLLIAALLLAATVRLRRSSVPI
jgi:ABC-2 type transport system permease protein